MSLTTKVYKHHSSGAFVAYLCDDSKGTFKQCGHWHRGVLTPAGWRTGKYYAQRCAEKMLRRAEGGKP